MSDVQCNHVDLWLDPGHEGLYLCKTCPTNFTVRNVATPPPAPVAGEAGTLVKLCCGNTVGGACQGECAVYTCTACGATEPENTRSEDSKFLKFATPHPVPGQTREVTAAPIKTNADEVCRASIKREWANLLALLEGHPNRSDILGCAHVLRNAERMQALGEVQNRAFFATVQGAAEAAAALEKESFRDR